MDRYGDSVYTEKVSETKYTGTLVKAAKVPDTQYTKYISGTSYLNLFLSKTLCTSWPSCQKKASL